VYFFGAFGALALFFVGFGYVIDAAAEARDVIPVTPIATLAPAPSQKVSGTIEAGTQVVMHLAGSGDDEYWQLEPFAVNDSTGRIAVDISALDGTGSFREVQPGSHRGDWWDGDSVAVIGDVSQNASGELVLTARYIARTPTSFNRDDFFVTLWGAVGIASMAGAALLLLRRRFRNVSHERNAMSYPDRVRGWRACPRCLQPVPSVAEVCPKCGLDAPVSKSPKPGTAQVQELQVGLTFSERPWQERAATVGLGILLPAGFVVLGVYLASTVGFRLNTGWLLPIILGITFAAVFLKGYVPKHLLILASDRIESRQFLSRERLRTTELYVTYSLKHGFRIGHFFLDRHGRSIGFATRASAQELEAIDRWMDAVESAFGVPHKRFSTLGELMEALGSLGPS